MERATQLLVEVVPFTDDVSVHSDKHPLCLQLKERMLEKNALVSQV